LEIKQKEKALERFGERLLGSKTGKVNSFSSSPSLSTQKTTFTLSLENTVKDKKLLEILRELRRQIIDFTNVAYCILFFSCFFFFFFNVTETKRRNEKRRKKKEKKEKKKIFLFI
jgi:hypothetical protein